jgi:hypothetical protein
MRAVKSALPSILLEPAHVALHQVEDSPVRRLRSEQRDLRLAAHARKPGEFANIVIDTWCIMELRRHQRLAADQQDGQSVGGCVDGTIDGNQSAGTGLVRRQHPGAQLLLQMRNERTHVGVVAAARAPHGVEPHLLAMEEWRRGLSRHAQRHRRQKTCAERSQDAARDLSSATRHFPRSTAASATRCIP